MVPWTTHMMFVNFKVNAATVYHHFSKIPTQQSKGPEKDENPNKTILKTALISKGGLLVMWAANIKEQLYNV